jgi:hypothetical protein
MAYTLQEFLALGPSKFASTKAKRTHGECCEDCYFDELGKLVEEHPIGIPGVRC